MNKFLNEFKDRGYFYQCTNENELSDLLDNKKIHAYIGFDSTASSLHVGSLIQIMCLRLLQKHGHRPIVLLEAEQLGLVIHQEKKKHEKFYLKNKLKVT